MKLEITSQNNHNLTLHIIPGKDSLGNFYLEVIFKGICLESHNLPPYFCLTQSYLNVSQIKNFIC